MVSKVVMVSRVVFIVGLSLSAANMILLQLVKVNLVHSQNLSTSRSSSTVFDKLSEGPSVKQNNQLPFAEAT
jgi:hypothetical protein